MTMQSFSAADFEGVPVPQRVWNVKDYFPHGEVSLMQGNGGEGKTTLALQLAVAKSARKDWLGMETRPGRTLFLSAEDDSAELHRRLDRMRSNMGLQWADLADVHLLPLVGEDAVLGAFSKSKGRVIATPILATLEERVCDIMIDTVILDTLSDVFCGDENDKQQARAFIHLLKGVTVRTDTSTLALAHPSLSGMANGTGTSGSTAWNNTVRSRLYFRSVGDNGVRKLQVMKANYGPANLCIHLKWQRGLYVLADEAEVPTPKVAKVKLKPNQATMLGLLSDAMPAGLLTEQWNMKGREQGIGVKRRSDFLDIRRALKERELVHEYADRWFVARPRSNETPFDDLERASHVTSGNGPLIRGP